MDKKNFEQSVTELENIVKKMENDALDLEESISLYEQGVKLTQDCQSMLKAAEKKIQKLMQDTTTDE